MTVQEAIGQLAEADFAYCRQVLGERLYRPDYEAPGDFYSWALVPISADAGGVRLHLHLPGSDDFPEHNHFWDNASLIVSGGYIETWRATPDAAPIVRELVRGDVLSRHAGGSHSTRLLPGCRYAVTLFIIGRDDFEPRPSPTCGMASRQPAGWLQRGEWHRRQFAPAG
jgi:hypothetical protein